MGNFGSAATPNDVYDFLKDKTCKFCNSELEVVDKSWHIGGDYFCTANCITIPHYSINIVWTDPKKNLQLESEVLTFDYDDNKYQLVLVFSADTSHLLGYDKGTAAISINEKVNFTAKVSDFSNMAFTEEAIVRRIETVRLLK